MHLQKEKELDANPIKEDHLWHCSCELGGRGVFWLSQKENNSNSFSI